MASVHLRNVTVNFPIYDTRSRSLKRRAMSLVTGGRVRSDPTGRISTDASHRVHVRALDRVDLTIEHGTRIGLIGRNGAGKSTLLHVLAGVYVPESGSVAVEGKIASLFGGSLGIDPELSGRENIELRGLYLGLSKSEINERMEEVIAFTELGPFIEMPFRSYSAGMRARLDFAISTAIEAEILLLDEGLGAGDAHACGDHAAAAGRLGIWQVRLQARAVYGGEPARGRISGRRELRRGEGRRERLLRHHRGRVGG
jgi:ABC-type polysaccharide/polyol phosphate transport system ATPase subunit